MVWFFFSHYCYSLDVVEERAPTPPPHSPPPPKPIRDADEQYSPYMDDPEAGNGTSYALRQQQLMMTGGGALLPFTLSADGRPGSAH